MVKHIGKRTRGLVSGMGVVALVGGLLFGGAPAAQADPGPNVLVNVAIPNVKVPNAPNVKVPNATVAVFGVSAEGFFGPYADFGITDDTGDAFFTTAKSGGDDSLVIQAFPPANLEDTLIAPAFRILPFPGDGEPVEEALNLPTGNRVYEILTNGQPNTNTRVDIRRPVFNDDGSLRTETPITSGQVDDSATFAISIADGNGPFDSVPGAGWKVRAQAPPGGVFASVRFDDTLSGDLVRTIDLPLANVRGTVSDSAGQSYQGARVSFEALQVTEDWPCYPQNIEDVNVNNDLASDGDDTFGFYADSSLTPDGYRIVVHPRFDDTSLVPTYFDYALDDTSTSTVRNLQLLEPNVSFRLLSPNGSPADDQFVELRIKGSNSCFLRQASTRGGGFGYMNVPLGDTGVEYEFRLYMGEAGFISWSKTTQELLDAAGTVIDLQVPNPNVTGSVDDTSGAPIAGATVRFEALSSDGWISQWLGQTTTDNTGSYQAIIDSSQTPYGFAVTVQPPNYDFSLGAPTRIDVVPDPSWDGSSLPIERLQLLEATVRGVLLDEQGAPLANTYISGNTYTGEQIPGMSTGPNGEFGLHVPTPVSPAAPARLNVWLQDEQRNVDFEISSLPFNGALQIPSLNLFVDVFDAENNSLEGADVQLFRSDGSFNEWVGFGRTDVNGSAGFAVDDTTIEYIAEVQPPPDSAFASTRVAVVPTDQGDGTALIEVEMASPNTQITVQDAQGAPVSNAWLYVREIEAFDGVSVQTDAAGIARLALDDTSGFFEIYVSAPWDRRDELVNQRLETELDTSGVLAELIIDMGSPNLSIRVQEPTALFTGLMYAQVEVRYADEPWGFNWTGTDQLGRASLDLEDGEYNIVVSPSFMQDGSSSFGPKTYRVVVEGDSVDVFDGATALVADQTGTFGLAVSNAQYSGVVEAGGVAVSNSWVEVFREVGNGDDTYLEWIAGAGTASNGTFGLTLPDDTYVVSALPEWGNRDYAASNPCQLVIANGVRNTSANGSCDDTLYLRAPNLTFIVTDGTQPVFNSWVCPVNTGNYACASSDRNGKVSFFIDDTVSIADDSVIFEIDPPWGSTDLAGVTLEIPKFVIGTAPSMDFSLNVPLAAPNVVITVQQGSPAVNARDGWVSIVRNDGVNFEWIGGSPVSRQGKANFNIADTSGTFCVEVWPGWNVRRDYGPVRECGVDLNSGSLTVELKSANVRTQVIDTDGRSNAYGWVEIEGTLGTPYTGGGVPLNETGRLATHLENGTYNLTFYPGWGRAGSPTIVPVVVSGGVANIASEITLSSGNIVGVGSIDGTPTAGLIVVFAGSDDTFTAVTGSDGSFRTELPPGTYTARVIQPPGSSGNEDIAITSGGSLTGSRPSWSLTVGS